ncbi:MAG TPA: hypothetical protein VHB21_13140, partial [Minicystis sp.]|nr:hypothetical protein [Minicystis sp.]
PCVAMLVACGGGGEHASASASGSTGAGGAGGARATTLSLPQFVHGAARVDAAFAGTIPIVVAATGATPDAVDVTVGDANAEAVKDGDRFVATLDATKLGDVPRAVTARATIGGREVATAKGTLSVAAGSLQFTSFSAVGPAYASHLAYDAADDALDLTWVSVAGGKHGLWLAEIDGAFERLHAHDVALGDPSDEPLDGHTAFADDGRIGVVYRTAKPGDVHWLVKMRVVDKTGKALVPTMDLTDGQAAFTPTQAGVDPGGFSAAWLHISPPNPSPPPVEVRFSRWDDAKKKLVGPITLDRDHPEAMGTTAGPQILEPLAELGVACNAKVCVVTYTRDVYIPLVDLNVPKLFVAVVDLAKGALARPPTPVEATDWDTQEFGHQVVALADGSFQLVYTANDTAAAVDPKTPCDESLERDLLFSVKLDASGKLVGKPVPIFDHEGSREFPRVSPHPAGFALFWEDQRSECAANGHIRMTANVAGPALGGLLDPYVELPDSVGLPPEDPTLATVATNFAVGWSDDRHGMGLADPKPEIFLDTYWRK